MRRHSTPPSEGVNDKEPRQLGQQTCHPDLVILTSGEGDLMGGESSQDELLMVWYLQQMSPPHALVWVDPVMPPFVGHLTQLWRCCHPTVWAYETHYMAAAKAV